MLILEIPVVVLVAMMMVLATLGGRILTVFLDHTVRRTARPTRTTHHGLSTR